MSAVDISPTGLTIVFEVVFQFIWSSFCIASEAIVQLRLWLFETLAGADFQRCALCAAIWTCAFAHQSCVFWRRLEDVVLPAR